MRTEESAGPEEELAGEAVPVLAGQLDALDLLSDWH